MSLKSVSERVVFGARPVVLLVFALVTVAMRPHWPAGGFFISGASSMHSSTRRSAVNSSGGNSRSASFEVRKFPAQARQISATSAKSRPPKPARPSVPKAESLVKLAQRPHGEVQRGRER